MRAKIGNIEVEGEPEELARFARMLQFDENASNIQALASGKSGVEFVSEEVAFRVLKRRPLSVEQKKFLSALLRKSPGWVTAFELHKAVGYTKMQLGGMLGAFGKRVSSTEGYVEGNWFYDQEWNYDEDCHQYRLPEHLIPALKRAGL